MTRCDSPAHLTGPALERVGPLLFGGHSPEARQRHLGLVIQDVGPQSVNLPPEALNAEVGLVRVQGLEGP